MLTAIQTIPPTFRNTTTHRRHTGTQVLLWRDVKGIFFSTYVEWLSVGKWNRFLWCVQVKLVLWLMCTRTCLCVKKFKKKPKVCSWRLCALLFSFCRREAIPMHMGQLRLALRSIRRAHQTLPETHRGQTLQVHRLQPLLLTLGPFGSAHEASPELNQIYLHIQTHSMLHKETAAWTNQLYKSQKENQNHPTPKCSGV